MLITGDVVIGENKRRNTVISPVTYLVSSLNVDASFSNLEIPLTERGSPSDKLVAWRSSPSVAKDLKKAGFTVMSIANNHALDYGREGLFDTIKALHSEGIRSVGAGINIDDALAPALIDLDEETKVAIIAVSCTLPLGTAARESRPGIAPIHVATSYEFDPIDLQEEPGCVPTYIHTIAEKEDVQRVSQVIQRMKQQGYIVLVSIHWGNAFQKRLAEYQPPLAQMLAEAGCDLIIGHHPHTIHAIEVIGNMPVFYSLGNFIMDSELVDKANSALPDSIAMIWIMSPEALIGIIELGEGRLLSVSVRPIVIDDNGVPKLADAPRAQQIFEEVERLSTDPIPWELRDGIGTIRLE